MYYIFGAYVCICVCVCVHAVYTCIQCMYMYVHVHDTVACTHNFVCVYACIGKNMKESWENYLCVLLATIVFMGKLSSVGQRLPEGLICDCVCTIILLSDVQCMSYIVDTLCSTVEN